MKKQEACILIIDDEPYIQEIITRGLKSFNYHFETANDAPEALAKMKTAVFDLVICDITLPKGDGVSLLKYIKAHYPDTAVIMLTAIFKAQVAIECMHAGASNYIIKPFEVNSLAFSIKEALEKRQAILENKAYQKNLENRVLEQTEHIQHIYLDTIKTIANCLEAKDVYTRGHSKRVTGYTIKLAEALSLPEKFLHQVRISGILHDIGKIGIPEAILNKPKGLTVEEYAQIKRHPQISVYILKPILHDQTIISNIQSHHERFDGKGYPHGLTGEEIPLGARILSIADAFDAMTSTRAYRQKMTTGSAIAELKKNMGTQFAPGLTSQFVEIVSAASSLKEIWDYPNIIPGEQLAFYLEQHTLSLENCCEPPSIFDRVLDRFK